MDVDQHAPRPLPLNSLTSGSTASSSNLELEHDASDVSSVHSSSEESQEGGIDLAASAWTDLGSFDSRKSGGSESRRTSSGGSSDDGRGSFGETARTNDLLVAEWTDLEPSLHSEAISPSSSGSSPSDGSDRSVQPSLASSLSTIASHTPTLMRPSLASQIPLFTSPITEEVMHLSFPDPSTVSSSFTCDASPALSQSIFLSSNVSNPAPSVARNSSAAMVAPLVHAELAPVQSSVDKAALPSPLHLRILYLGSPLPSQQANLLLHTLLNLLADSRLIDHSASAHSLSAQLKQYDLLGGAESSRFISDIREPFRRERKGSSFGTPASSSKIIDEKGCKSGELTIEIGDLTVEPDEENEADRIRIREHFSDIAADSVFPTVLLALTFLSPKKINPLEPINIYASTPRPTPFIETFSIACRGKTLPLNEFLSQKGRLASQEVWNCLSYPVGKRKTEIVEAEQRPMAKIGKWLFRYILSVSLLCLLVFGGLDYIGSLPPPSSETHSTDLSVTPTLLVVDSTATSLDSASITIPPYVTTLPIARRSGSVELPQSLAPRVDHALIQPQLALAVSIANSVSASIDQAKKPAGRGAQEPKRSQALMTRPRGDLVELKHIITDVLAELDPSGLLQPASLPAYNKQNLSLAPRSLSSLAELPLVNVKTSEVSLAISSMPDFIDALSLFPTLNALLNPLRPYLRTLDAIASSFSLHANLLTLSAQTSLKRARRGLRTSEAKLEHLARHFRGESERLLLLAREEMKVAEGVAEKIMAGAKRSLEDEMEEGKDAMSLTAKRSTAGLRRLVGDARRVLSGLEGTRRTDGGLTEDDPQRGQV